MARGRGAAREVTRGQGRSQGGGKGAGVQPERWEEGRGTRKLFTKSLRLGKICPPPPGRVLNHLDNESTLRFVSPVRRNEPRTSIQHIIAYEI